MLHFAANVLELTAPKGHLIALSTTALSSLSPPQRRILEAHAALIPVEIPTIERVGGGGVRCMLAEIHLPKRIRRAPDLSHNLSMLELGVKLLLAYLLGTLLGSLFLGRMRGVDIRSMGSGNAGATNALRTQGKLFGFLVLLIDIAKGVHRGALAAVGHPAWHRHRCRTCRASGSRWRAASR